MELAKLLMSDLLQEFDPLVHHVLKRLNIKRYYMNYDDLCQELRIKLIEIIKRFDGNPKGQDKGRFITYARKGLYWHAISLLRKDKSGTELDYDTAKLANQLQLSHNPEVTWQSDLAIAEFYRQAKIILNPTEYQVFTLLNSQLYTMQEIADLMSLSRKTIYHYKLRIQKKLQLIKKELVD